MIYPPIKELMEAAHTPQRYLLVTVTAKRARELVAGATPRVDCKIVRPVSTAITELYAGKVTFHALSPDSMK